MSHQFQPGDDLIFQLESAFGLLRVLAVEGEGPNTVWHLLAYDDFFRAKQFEGVACYEAAPGANQSSL